MKHIGRYLRLILCIFLILGEPETGNSQTRNRTVERRLKEFFQSYQANQVNIGSCKLVRYQLNPQKRTLTIHANANFGYQPFRPETTEHIYKEIRKRLPGPINYYNITILVGEKSIDDLIPNCYRKTKDESRLWGETVHKGTPWTQNLSLPYSISDGLQGRHIAITPSHGMFYKNDEKCWKWQRPSLYCTREDLLSQSIVVPYLIPMLENAGAVVFSARERDRQPYDIIIDNDPSDKDAGLYIEEHHRKTRWDNTATGFSIPQMPLNGTDNPFTNGTARLIHTTEKESEESTVLWIPQIPETGTYAVYVSYQSHPLSVSDAQYYVVHKGGTTRIRVNQQMGGGTWVYIGTFEFEQGQHTNQMIALSNKSKEKGVVCADAVRLGGGTSVITRGDEGTTSGMPRYYEGARYQSQWAGFPSEYYANYNGEKDYAEDINSRSLVTNYLLGGSVYCPDSAGLRVPIELSLSLHTDAGIKEDDAVVGTLGIYTTDYNHSRLGNSTLSRYTSRDLTDITMSTIIRDIHSYADSTFTRRAMWDKNYSESRLPDVPSAIIELLSHQNFADMRYAHDPHFKFITARAIYKSILQYTALMHGTTYTVQPLPVNTMAISFAGPEKIRLSWKPTIDKIEKTATPNGYILYTRIDNGGFDNGQFIPTNQCEITLERGRMYSFKVTAVNKGGESFPSEVLSAHIAEKSKGTVLIVNGFQRISGPKVICNEQQAGFDLLKDPGVPYIGTTAFSGIQKVYDREMAGYYEESEQLGASGEELCGSYMAGNTMDYTITHGISIKKAGYSFVSCSRKAFEYGVVKPEGFDVIDLYFGLQHNNHDTTVRHPDYSIVTQAMLNKLTQYTRQGGHLLTSGAYLGYESQYNPFAHTLLHNILGVSSSETINSYEESHLYGLENHTIEIPRWINPEQYPVVHPEILKPVEGAFTPFIYENSKQSAAVANIGTFRSVTLGFPFEAIRSQRDRDIVMLSLLHFLTQR